MVIFGTFFCFFFRCFLVTSNNCCLKTRRNWKIRGVGAKFDREIHGLQNFCLGKKKLFSCFLFTPAPPASTYENMNFESVESRYISILSVLCAVYRAPTLLRIFWNGPNLDHSSKIGLNLLSKSCFYILKDHSSKITLTSNFKFVLPFLLLIQLCPFHCWRLIKLKF